ncbi:MAG: SDR family NAD(P)-dependent oxidoreductase, partial [Verrucomicrobiota bacterium]|nr:SDR family NAD(P)-dependent oxidoreductase [Verrucomicrobiota bacterium]
MPNSKTYTEHMECFSRFSVIIITGGSSGIGCSIIKALISINPDLILCNLSRSEPEIFLGKNGIHYPVDLCDEKALAATVEAIKKRISEAPMG